MNALNLPLALATVVLRRYIDKILTYQGEIVLDNAPWIIEPSLFKFCMYAYMFSAGLWYTLKNMKKGTVVSLAKRCSGGAVNVKYVRKKCLDKNRKASWMMDNLLKNRENQQRALEYVSSLTPHRKSSCRECNLVEPSRYRENLNHRSTISVRSKSNRNIPNFNYHQNVKPVHNDCPYYSSFNHDPAFENHEFGHDMTSADNDQALSNEQQCDVWHRGDTCQNPSTFHNQQIEHYRTNPYFKPKVVPYTRPNPFISPETNFNHPYPGLEQDPSKHLCYTAERCMRQNTGDAPRATVSKEATSEHSVLIISDDSTSVLLEVDTKARKRRSHIPTVRNLYTLRGRKINAYPPSQDGKTRSGKVYSYHSPKSRRKNR